MNSQVFGLDFGTTNSLAALVIGDEVRTLTDTGDKPHPSVVWFRGSEIIVGRQARQHIESLDSGTTNGFVRSPKMLLRRDGLAHIDGRTVEPADIVAHVLSHIKRSAANRSDRSYDIARAVMTVPVDFGGAQRRTLRAAARKAGIGVLQFVHEPAAALYAYLRSRPDFQRELARLENRVLLVFDWGGGTLDLTVCRVVGGVIMQIANRGNNDIGGDRFDENIRNFIRDRHAEHHSLADITALEQAGAGAKLLTQCEMAKIALSASENFTVIAKDYLRGDVKSRNLAVDITRADLELLTSNLVNSGLAEIDRLLEDARLDRSDIELCLATGGMVNMPAIWTGLVERFGARVPAIKNRDSIIAEGAAWIAHDQLRLTLAKQIEVVVTDGRGRGTYLPLVDAGLPLPVENQTIAASQRRFFCCDPQDGTAVFEFTKPRKVGLVQPGDERATLRTISLPVDPDARPFLERLECEIQIDHDYVARALIRSKLRGEQVEAEFHDLDFGLALPVKKPQKSAKASDSGNTKDACRPNSSGSSGLPRLAGDVNLSLRSNISEEDNNWRLVPGDLVKRWKPNFLVKDSTEPSEIQREEEMYYARCALCHRTVYQLTRQGPVHYCRQSDGYLRPGCPT